MTLGRTSGVSILPLAIGLLLPLLARAESHVAVAVVHSAAWSPESGREGAGEFLVLVEGAKLRKTSSRAGLIVLGDQHGMLRSGGERALRRLALSGVVVVRVASGGAAAATPEMLFVDAGARSEMNVTAALRRALETVGGPPRAADPDHPTAGEIASVQAHLKRLQGLFDPHAPIALAATTARARAHHAAN